MTFELRNPVLACSLAALAVLSGGSALADKGGNDNRTVGAQLSGFQEVPVVSTKGSGEFKAKINSQTNEIEYEFSYADMQATVLQAHIHLGQRGVNGGIMVWLCQSAANPAPAAVAGFTPVCSSPAFSSGGIINAASIVGPGGAQQLGAGELAELVAAFRAGVAYVNVHTATSPGGEIRGQIRSGSGHGHGH
ncbi:CHRD domain-containing protein [Aquincola sp. S2]|uniref:CHRD domain-containing protein n=1 Tax=Pseudaquabacterium terrae TaxID=2732868 RepID=A0ABX2EER0_9BURK|nr:CHRD domain-containing protein [Aquabacterium terrae]NRF67091.1 CHRD domain-containing protein [Aquabacterium terrae]